MSSNRWDGSEIHRNVVGTVNENYIFESLLCGVKSSNFHHHISNHPEDKLRFRLTTVKTIVWSVYYSKGYYCNQIFKSIHVITILRVWVVTVAQKVVIF